MRSSLWVGALAGYVASRTMDLATTWFYGRQSTESRQREDELAPGGALVQLGHQLGRAVGQQFGDDTAGRIGTAVHRALGIGYGLMAATLVRRGVGPVAAGMAVGTAAFVLVDEGTAITKVAEYPLVSHARGVVGHATLGFTCGVLLWLTGMGHRTRV